MQKFIKTMFSGPEKRENYKPLEWEKNDVLRSYWDNDLPRNNMQDQDYPQPKVLDDIHLQKDAILWDNCSFFDNDKWGAIHKETCTPVKSFTVGNHAAVEFVELSEAHDQNKDFRHNNEQPFFTGNPYYVTERPIDDGIDYYKRNDIRQRRSMKPGDFTIIGHDRDTNLNRRGANLRANIESSIMPSRWKHDKQSIMPWDQLRDHTHGGKLYLPGDEPTAEDPLGVTYRPQEKTYEELFNKSRVEAPGRFNTGLMGEKLVYHPQIEHLKRKNVDKLGQWDHNGFMMASNTKDSVRSLQNLKSELKTMPVFEHYGGAVATKAYADRVEGFSTAKQANRGRGKDTVGTLLGIAGETKHKTSGKVSKAKKQINTIVSDGGLNQVGDKIEHFNYTTWEPLEKREEKLFAVWNSRIEGFFNGLTGRGHTVRSNTEGLKKSGKEHLETAVRPEGNLQGQETRGFAVAGANESQNKNTTQNKVIFGDTQIDGTQIDALGQQGNIIRNDKGTAKGLRNKFSAMYSEVATRLGGGLNTIAKGQTSGKITSSEKNRKKNFEQFTYEHAPVDRLASNGYLITEHEPRETLRTKIVNNYFGGGLKDSGFVLHEGVNNIEWHKDRMRKANVSESGTQINGPQKQDLATGADQIFLDIWHKSKRVIDGQVINPGARSLHGIKYGGEGLVNRKGTNSKRKVERAVNDGVMREFSFIQPRFTANGKDTAKERNREARRASRIASKILPA
jgi:hypothetical protein